MTKHQPATHARCGGSSAAPRMPLSRAPSPGGRTTGVGLRGPETHCRFQFLLLPHPPRGLKYHSQWSARRWRWKSKSTECCFVFVQMYRLLVRGSHTLQSAPGIPSAPAAPYLVITGCGTFPDAGRVCMAAQGLLGPGQCFLLLICGLHVL